MVFPCLYAERVALTKHETTLKLYIALIVSQTDVQSVADVVRRGRLRRFGHLERKSADDWVLACDCGGGEMCGHG